MRGNWKWRSCKWSVSKNQINWNPWTKSTASCYNKSKPKSKSFRPNTSNWSRRTKRLFYKTFQTRSTNKTRKTKSKRSELSTIDKKLNWSKNSKNMKTKHKEFMNKTKKSNVNLLIWNNSFPMKKAYGLRKNTKCLRNFKS